MKTNDNQRAAVNKLKKALGACRLAGVRLFGMDNVLYATVKHDDGKDFHENYQASRGGDPDLIEEIVCGGVYIDSGGW